MGCADCCGKCLLVLINIFFLLLGLLILVIGVLLQVATEILSPLVGNFLNLGLANVTSTDSPELAIGDAIGALLDVSSIGIVLIVIGLVMFIVGCFGCCGACCTVKCMLATYIVCVMIIFLAQLVLLVLTLIGFFYTHIDTALMKSLQEDYTGKPGDGVTFMWDSVMQDLECCGMESYKDFQNSSSWYRYDDMTINKTITVPYACCKTQSDSAGPTDCPYLATDENSNANTGCWGVMNELYIEGGKNIFIGVWCGFLAFDLCVAAIAICILVRDRKKDEYQ